MRWRATELAVRPTTARQAATRIADLGRMIEGQERKKAAADVRIAKHRKEIRLLRARWDLDETA